MIERKHYRSVDFNDERKWKHKNPYDDVVQVGKQKSIGYVVLDHEDELNQFSIDKDKFSYMKFDEEGKFYVYHVGDKQMMQTILDQNKDLVIAAGWEVDAEFVFNKICTTHPCHEGQMELYHLICDLFNSWCLWCDPIDWRDIGQGRRKPFSVDPFDPDL